MKDITFEIVITPTVIQSDRQGADIKTLDAKGLRRLANGKITILFERSKSPIVIKSEVIDYLIQLKGVVDQIDSGNHETFTVSGDYFSNNLRFTYLPPSKELVIYEANGGSFKITTPYEEFRASLLEFYQQSLCDLKSLYPELADNDEFRRVAC